MGGGRDGIKKGTAQRGGDAAQRGLPSVMGMQLQVLACWGTDTSGPPDRSPIRRKSKVMLIGLSDCYFHIFFYFISFLIRELRAECGRPILQYWAKFRVASAAVAPLLLVGAAWEEGGRRSVLAFCTPELFGARFPASVECRPTNSSFFCQKRPRFPMGDSRQWVVGESIPDKPSKAISSIHGLDIRTSPHPSLHRREPPLLKSSVSFAIFPWSLPAYLHENVCAHHAAPCGTQHARAQGRVKSEKRRTRRPQRGLSFSSRPNSFCPGTARAKRARLGALIGRPAHPRLV